MTRLKQVPLSNEQISEQMELSKNEFTEKFNSLSKKVDFISNKIEKSKIENKAKSEAKISQNEKLVAETEKSEFKRYAKIRK